MKHYYIYYAFQNIHMNFQQSYILFGLEFQEIQFNSIFIFAFFTCIYLQQYSLFQFITKIIITLHLFQ
jgi:hypothetical protein